MAIPAWQTADLDEEWVESSPSPPPTLNKPSHPSTKAPSNESHPRHDPASIRAKRGSLRALGHAAPRSLPVFSGRSTTSPQAGSPRIISGHGEGRVLSEKIDYANQNSLVLSPPQSSGSGDENGPKNTEVAGTFVVKDGVDDDRGRHLARKGKEKDMFGPSALEKLFKPPSPIVENRQEGKDTGSTAPSTPCPAPNPATSTNHESDHDVGREERSPSVEELLSIRKASNPYAPANPSRLSKSMTPSSASSSFSATIPYEQTADSRQDFTLPTPEDVDQSQDATESSLIVDQDNVNEGEKENIVQELKSGEVETDLSLHKDDYQFTFSQPPPRSPRQPQYQPQRSAESPFSASPSLSPFRPDEQSHSTIHHRGSVKGQPKLRLFRSTYDTYTREHLSALVDSIAVDSSPSPPPLPPASGSKWRTRAFSDEPESSDSRDDERSRSSTDETEASDSRSSKRMRMSPSSPARRPNGVRDWAAEGKALIERLRAANGSTTTDGALSLERSASQGLSTTPRSRSEEQPSIEYDQASSRSPSPPALPALTRQNLDPNRPTHRSNPSTTSSTYLRRAEELMDALRAGAASDSSRTEEADDGREVYPDPAASATGSSRATSNDWDIEAIAQRAKEAREARDVQLHQQRDKGKQKVAPSPRRLLRRLSASEEIRQAANESSEEEQMVQINSKSRLDARRPTSASGSDQQMNGVDTRMEDLNRFVSATTVATATTMSSSFVKHPGPRAKPSTHTNNGQGGLRMIRPDEVAGIVPDKVGRMRFDKTLMRWVKEREEPLSGIEELAEGTASASGSRPNSAADRLRRTSRSRSEESEDVFAGMDSWGRESRASPVRPVDPQNEEEASEESESEEDNRYLVEHNTTMIQEGTESDSEEEQEEGAAEGRDEMHTARTTLPPHQSPLVASPRSMKRPSPPQHASSAPAIMTPMANNPFAPKPIRSALRNAANGPNSLTPGATPGVKKQSWHESLTPAPDSGARRSVSFSDGKKSGRMRDLHPDETATTVESELTHQYGGEIGYKEETYERKGRREDEEWFMDRGEGEAEGEASWMPSMRTRRIEGLMQGMDDLSLDSGTPSKPPKPTASLVESPEADLLDLTADEADSTIRQEPTRLDRSYRPSSRRNDANATFLTECSFGVTHDRLVNLITDVYGSEPYWEGLTLLDLRGKEVESVTRLKEFLPDLREVNLTNNKISYLSGIPSRVASLHVSRNRLTSMSSVDHLLNLTHLDISHNLLDGVSQLACLHKLVELKMDDNPVKDLSVVMGLSTLVKLSARSNKVSKLDLRKANWPKMQTLDLANNRITRVDHLDRLSALRDLNLENNRLESFVPPGAITSLRTLRLSDNDLTTLDLAVFPKVRTLYADRNKITLLSCGAVKCRLENLSLRNQSLDATNGEIGLDVDWTALSGLKRLYVSGNQLPPRFFPVAPLRSMIYLEAAACGLTSWLTDPALSTVFPNLEVLNLNYNYLQNLHGLRGLRGLRKVSVVGNRLGGDEGGVKGVGVMAGLKDLTGLEEVDLRMNPSTLGFYLPLILPHQTPTTTEEEEQTPRAAQNPLPNVTLATIRPPDTPAPKGRTRLQAATARGMPSEADWNVLDGQFRKSLPDEWYSKRLVYRGLIMGQLPSLRLLDGVKVEEGERRKAGLLLDLAGAA